MWLFRGVRLGLNEKLNRDRLHTKRYREDAVNQGIEREPKTCLFSPLRYKSLLKEPVIRSQYGAMGHA